jgi:hypothetical protein
MSPPLLQGRTSPSLIGRTSPSLGTAEVSARGRPRGRPRGSRGRGNGRGGGRGAQPSYKVCPILFPPTFTLRASDSPSSTQSEADDYKPPIREKLHKERHQEPEPAAEIPHRHYTRGNQNLIAKRSTVLCGTSSFDESTQQITDGKLSHPFPRFNFAT